MTRLSLLMILLLTAWTGCAASQSPRPIQEASTPAPPATAQQAAPPISAFTPCRQDSTTACGTPPPPAHPAGLGTDQPDSASAAKGSAPTPPVPLDPSRRYRVATQADDPRLGPADAPVTVVVFSDFECPYCAQLVPVISELRRRFDSQLQVVWKDLPLASHAFALEAAALARDAYTEHGNERFWQMHDELFANQRRFSEEWLEQLARVHELRWPPAPGDLRRVQQNIRQADELGIQATPTTFINGRPVVGAKHISVYADIIHEELGSGH